MNFYDVIRSGDFLVLDTETTGLDRFAEICQIAVIDSAGTVLIDTLVKPAELIPGAATAIHGITNNMVAEAPRWGDVSRLLLPMLRGRHVVVYNALYDRKLMHQSAERARLEKIDWKTIADFHCAMLAFAKVFGDWNDYHHDYRWQTLTTAARYYNLPNNNAHSALGDCLTTLAVCKAMAAAEAEK